MVDTVLFLRPPALLPRWNEQLSHLYTHADQEGLMLQYYQPFVGVFARVDECYRHF